MCPLSGQRHTRALPSRTRLAPLLLCPQPCTQHLGEPPPHCQCAVSRSLPLASLSAAISLTRRVLGLRRAARKMIPLAPAGTTPRSQVAPAQQRRRKAPVLWASDRVGGGRSSFEILIDWLTTNDNYARCSRRGPAAFPLKPQLWLPDGGEKEVSPKKNSAERSWRSW